MTTDMIGRLGAVVPLPTVGRQVYVQWRDKSPSASTARTGALPTLQGQERNPTGVTQPPAAVPQARDGTSGPHAGCGETPAGHDAKD